MKTSRFILSNQPLKGEIYYAVRITKNGKFIGYHNGYRRVNRPSWFDQSFLDYFMPELKVKCEANGLTIEVKEKVFNK